MRILTFIPAIRHLHCLRCLFIFFEKAAPPIRTQVGNVHKYRIDRRLIIKSAYCCLPEKCMAFFPPQEPAKDAGVCGSYNQQNSQTVHSKCNMRLSGIIPAPQDQEPRFAKE